ncbi:MAG TPA: NAD(P)/FAD-dependent oxidoreductase [Candidatus Micrarchaeia archaeon]|nr:NAD(P)/FAD-dependent oxidoreductase [Candidatus Micrarchaeia archaeon]
MQATQYDAIIVGGGHNGLVCAAYLARAGQRVVVLERRGLVGGACVTEEPWPGYRVNTCSYVVSLLPPDIVRQLELPRFGYEVIPLDPLAFTPFPDGRSIMWWYDPTRTAAEIAKISTHDAVAYLDYERALDELVQIVRPLFDMVPPLPQSLRPEDVGELLRMGRHLYRHRRGLSRLVDLMTLSVSDFLDCWFEDEQVKGAMSPGGVIGAWGGPKTPGTAYVLLHHRLGEAGNQRGAWGFVRGGMGRLSEAIAASARSAGAEVRTDAPVARIDVIAGRAVGVTLDDGTALRAPVVAAAVHPQTAFLQMVERQELPRDFVREIETYRTRGSSAKVNLALGELPDFTARPGTAPQDHHVEFELCPSIDYLETAWDDAKRGSWSRQPMMDCVIPSIKDPSLAPAGGHVMTCFVQYAPYHLVGSDWDREREGFGDRVVETLSAYAPNIAGAILHRQVVTPLDLERTFGLLGGNIFHGEMALDQMLSFRPAAAAAAYRTPLQGLYLCASGAHPGGGVMGTPARNAARVILADQRGGWRRWVGRR